MKKENKSKVKQIIQTKEQSGIKELKSKCGYSNLRVLFQKNEEVMKIGNATKASKTIVGIIANFLRTFKLVELLKALRFPIKVGYIK